MEEIRSQFPQLKEEIRKQPLIYFDSAATSLKPRCVIDSLRDFYSYSYGTVHRAVYTLSVQATDRYNESRKTIQTFINAKKEDEIIFTKGTTDGINLVASSYGKAFIQEGDEILISTLEHHSNIVPWQLIAHEKKAHLKVIPINSLGEIDFEAYKQLISDKTKIVAITHVSNALGTINPLKKIINLAHSYHAHVLVDGAQAIAHLPVNVQDLDVDFYAFSSHKMFGPTGVGVLYGKEELLDKMPPYQGGGDMIEKVTFEKTTYAPLPLKFEAGTPNIAGVIGLKKAVDFISNLGFDSILEHDKALLNYATKKLDAIEEVNIIGRAKNKSAIISFNVKGIHPLDIGTLLDLHGVAVRTGHHCTQPLLDFYNVGVTVRASFSIFNTIAEIDLFIDFLKIVIKKLKVV